MGRRELLIELKIRLLLLGAKVFGGLAGPPHRASMWCGRRAAHWMQVLAPSRDNGAAEDRLQ
jgi:hypothetical protein